MKPVLILQHLNADGPAYLAQWLRREGRPFELRNTEAGDAFPRSIVDYAGLAVLGGEWSANDDRPSLRDAERLIVEATEAGVPVLGHCLGGQLMARALGGKVIASPKPEVGWHRIKLLAGSQTRHWFGDGDSAMVFQWHYDSFELPHGAVLLAASDACPQQAFAIGPHLAMQFHVELDEAKLQEWVKAHDLRHEQATAHATVHDRARMVEDTQRFLQGQQALADRIYATWLS
jgi:GMP synthase (glutamine-hydrolysing)